MNIRMDIILADRGTFRGASSARGERYRASGRTSATCDGVPNASRVDAERPSLADFPRFAAVERRACVLRAGDALFIPKGVWHYARSLSPSLSVSFWFSRAEQGQKSKRRFSE